MKSFKEILKEKKLEEGKSPPLFIPSEDDVKKLDKLYKKHKGKSTLKFEADRVQVDDGMSNLNTKNIFDGDEKIFVTIFHTNHITFWDSDKNKNLTVKDIKNEINRLENMVSFMKSSSKINPSFPHFGI